MRALTEGARRTDLALALIGNCCRRCRKGRPQAPRPQPALPFVGRRHNIPQRGGSNLQCRERSTATSNVQALMYEKVIYTEGKGIMYSIRVTKSRELCKTQIKCPNDSDVRIKGKF